MSTEIITPNTRINRYSDFRLVITMTKDGEAYVPAQFRFIFYVEDWDDCPGRYTASCIKGITTNCAVEDSSITVFFNSPNFNLGELKCRFYDITDNGNFADGTLDTCTPVTLPVEIVSGAGDAEVVNISVQYAGSGSIDIDTSDFMTKSEYTYPIDQLNPRISGKIKYWALPDQAVDYIDGIGDAHIATTGTIYGASSGNVYMSKRSGEQLLYSAEDRVIFNKDDGHLYTYDGEAWSQVGGSSSGGEGTVTGVRMNGTTHEPTDGVVDLGTVITEHQDISGKANSADLATVATSGSYDDLSNKPTIPAEQVNADWNASSGKAQILHKPTIPSKTSDLTNDSGYINRAMYYGECDTAGATMPKVCTVETFPTAEIGGVTHAADGTVIAVKFTNSDTNTTAAPSLNVNGIGAKAIMYNNAIVTSTAKNTTIAGYAKQIAYYRYDASLDSGNGAWEYLGKSVDSNSTYSPVSLGFGFATQSNSSASATITATLSSYALTTNGIVSVKFNYDVPASATLNINSKGAKAIYNRGAAIAAGVIKAGDTATFIYSTYYHLISVDRSDSVTVDSTITQIGTNPVQGAAIYSALEGKVNYQEYDTEDDVYNDTSQPNGTIGYQEEDGDFYIRLDSAWIRLIPYHIAQDMFVSRVPQTRTVNGKALSSNITLNASDVGAMAEATVVEVSTAGAVSQALSPNTFYKFTGALTSLTLTLTAGTGLVVYAGKFTTGSGWGSNGLSIPATVTEAAGNDEIAASKTYEFSILDNVIVIKEV